MAITAMIMIATMKTTTMRGMPRMDTAATIMQGMTIPATVTGLAMCMEAPTRSAS